MLEIDTPQKLRRLVWEKRKSGARIGFVATMGALHAGHLALVENARNENDVVVMSVFVNPSQFGPHEDFERYPRNLRQDARLGADSGVDIFFHPSVDAMYPEGLPGQLTWVDPSTLASTLCGASRPGHFRGVCTVVCKLFNMVTPDRAYFGQKDLQQALILTRMVRDLAFPIDIRIVPTVREPDGLALSSRNRFLSPEEREQASMLGRSLQMARDLITSGERRPRVIEAAIEKFLASNAPLARVDYISVVSIGTLQPVDGLIQEDAAIALAVYFGSTRLIDNVITRFEDCGPTFS